MSTNRIYGPTPAPGAAGSQPSLNASGVIAAVLPAVQTLNSTTTETVIVNPSLPTTALVVSIPPQSPLEGRRFFLESSGYLNFGTSSSATLKVYAGSSTTVGNNTLLGSSGAITAFAGKVPYSFSLEGNFDSVSGKFQGTIEFVVNNTLVAKAALSNVVTGINNARTDGQPVISFCFSLTCGVAGVQVIGVDEFAVVF